MLKASPNTIDEARFCHQPTTRLPTISSLPITSMLTPKASGKRPKIVVAVVIAEKNLSKGFETNLLNFCKDKLANFKIPKKIILKESLPKNASGKVLKNELRNMFN